MSLFETRQSLENKIKKYGPINNYDLLKSFAFLNMLIDHLGYYLFPEKIFLRFIGRFSSPIFFLLCGYSFKINSKENNNGLILFFGCLTVLATYILNDEVLPVSVLLTIYISSNIIPILKEMFDKCYPLFVLVFILFAPLSTVLNYIIDYSTLASMMMFSGFLLRNEKKTIKALIAILFAFTIFSWSQILPFILMERVLLKKFLFYKLAFVIFMSLLFVLGCNFNTILKGKTYDFRSKIINNFILMTSRYSVFLYFTHILIILLVKRWLF